MGADMCIVCLYWDRKRKLNWKAGIKAIKALKYIKNEDGVMLVASDAGMDYKQETLLGYLKDLEDSSGRRDVWEANFGHLSVLITGGMTWGDDPSDLYTAITALQEVDYDILRAVGFELPEDDTDYRELLMKVLKVKEILPLLIGLDKHLDTLVEKKLKK